MTLKNTISIPTTEEISSARITIFPELTTIPVSDIRNMWYAAQIPPTTTEDMIRIVQALRADSAEFVPLQGYSTLVYHDGNGNLIGLGIRNSKRPHADTDAAWFCSR